MMNEKVFFSFGEVGLDAEASPGNGAFYCTHYESGHDVCGFETLEEAVEELKFAHEAWSKEPWMA